MYGCVCVESVDLCIEDVCMWKVYVCVGFVSNFNLLLPPSLCFTPILIERLLLSILLTSFVYLSLPLFSSFLLSSITRHFPLISVLSLISLPSFSLTLPYLYLVSLPCFTTFFLYLSSATMRSAQ